LLRGLLRRWLDLPAASGRVERFLEWVPAADGTRLATAVFRPDSPSRSVVVARTDALVHTPRQPAGLLARLIAEQGHTVVLQECRGLHASEGRFEPFVNEAKDGAALLDWVRREPDGDRPLTLLGFGYGAYAAWAARAASATAVDGVIAAFGARDPYAWTHCGGALRLASTFELAFQWDGADADAPSEIDLARALEHRPLLEADRVGARRIDWLREWLEAPTADSFWREREAPLPELPPATLLIGGWRHPALPSQLDDYAVLARASAASGAPRPQLLVGPWGRLRLPRGEGRHQVRLVREVMRSVLRFVDSIAPASTPRRDEPVMAFVSGDEAWHHDVTWPPASARLRSFALGGDGANGKGELRETATEGPAGTDLYVYDPADAPRGDAHELAVDAPRGDVLRYTTPPLSHALELAGTPEAHLFVSSRASRTDFVVRLYEVDRKGRVRWLSDGIRRDAAHDVPVQITLEPVWHRISAGARLRLEVTSACFPRFDRHPNTAVLPARAEHDAGVPALQALHHGGERPSRLELPVVDEA
jgi:putative CocE/NonD family hydrolase